ncbi:MAG TPA: glycosyltransferase family 87 protein, partial [Chloroflexia bacterium]|nr:glycosyltransferase family 87 protein [Chloroflexia bacterium]
MLAPSAHPPRRWLRPGFAGRLARAGCLTVVVGYVVLAGLTVARRGGPLPFVVGTDLVAILTGARILEQGQPELLYDRGAEAAAQTEILRQAGLGPIRLLPYLHPPFEALVLAPLHAAGLSYPGIFACWVLLGLTALAGSLVLLAGAWPLPPGTGRLGVLAVASFLPVFVAVLLGQNSGILVLAWAGASVFLRRGADGRAGALLALAAIKPQALPVLLLVLLITGRWRALAGFAVALGVPLVATLPLLGWDWPLRYLPVALSAGGYPPDPTVDPSLMPNWRGQI